MAALARRRLELLSVELADLRESVTRVPEEGEVPAVSPERAVAPGRHARRPVALTGRLGGWVHDRLPPTLQGRVRLSGGHLTVVALVVAGALALVGVIHSPLRGGPILAPDAVRAELARTGRLEATGARLPTDWALAYGAAAAVVLLLGRSARRGAGGVPLERRAHRGGGVEALGRERAHDVREVRPADHHLCGLVEGVVV